MISRRTLIRGASCLLAAPAIVRAASLMPVRSLSNKPYLFGTLFPSNRTIRVYMDVHAIRDRNVLLQPAEYAGHPVASFRGIPILIKDEATKWPTSPLETALMRGPP